MKKLSIDPRFRLSNYSSSKFKLPGFPFLVLRVFAHSEATTIVYIASEFSQVLIKLAVAASAARVQHPVKAPSIHPDEFFLTLGIYIYFLFFYFSPQWEYLLTKLLCMCTRQSLLKKSVQFTYISLCTDDIACRVYRSRKKKIKYLLVCRTCMRIYDFYIHKYIYIGVCIYILYM